MERIDLPEELAFGELQERELVSIRGVEGHSVAPPALDRVEADRAVPGELQAEEDDDHGDGETRVKSGGQNVCKYHIVSSGAADGEGERAQLYLVHHAKWRRRMI